MVQPGAKDKDFTQAIKESYDPALNRLRVDAIVTDGVDGLIINPDGSINVVSTATDLDIRDLDASQDNVAISDGSDTLSINADGSINVNIVSGSVASSDYRSYFNEVTSVPAATPTTIQTYTVPVALDAFLQRVEVSGTNIATYEVLINAVVQDKLRSYFGNSLNIGFEFANSATDGYPLVTGDVVLVRVTHNRPMVGDFNSRIQVVEV